MIIDSQNLNTLRKGFNKLFQDAFAGTPVYWDQIAMKVTSEDSEETYGWLGSSTSFREWVGDRVVQNLAEHDYSLKNKKWENTVSVKADKIKDDRLGIYTPMFQTLGYDAKTHPDKLMFELIASGFTSLCYDGQYFFDTDHPVGPSGNPTSVSNYQAGASAPWYLLDISRPTKPFIYQVREEYVFVAKDSATDDNAFWKDEYVYGAHGRSNVGFGLWQLAAGSKADLTADNYQALRTLMMSQKNDAGVPLGIKPNILLCGSSNEGKAKTILEAETISATSNINRGSAKLLCVPWLP